MSIAKEVRNAVLARVASECGRCWTAVSLAPNMALVGALQFQKQGMKLQGGAKIISRFGLDIFFKQRGRRQKFAQHFILLCLFFIAINLLIKTGIFLSTMQSHAYLPKCKLIVLNLMQVNMHKSSASSFYLPVVWTFMQKLLFLTGACFIMGTQFLRSSGCNLMYAYLGARDLEISGTLLQSKLEYSLACIYFKSMGRDKLY